MKRATTSVLEGISLKEMELMVLIEDAIVSMM